MVRVDRPIKFIMSVSCRECAWCFAPSRAVPVLLRLLRASPRPLSLAVSVLAAVRLPLVRSPRFFCCPPLRPSARASFCPPRAPGRRPPSCLAPRCLRAACSFFAPPARFCPAAPPSVGLPSGPFRLLGHLPSAAGSIHMMLPCLLRIWTSFLKRFGVLIVVFRPCRACCWLLFGCVGGSPGGSVLGAGFF